MTKDSDIKILMRDIGVHSRAASKVLSTATSERKCAALVSIAESLRDNMEKILESNSLDCERAHSEGLSSSKLDRLRLDKTRILDMSTAATAIAELTDPIGEVISSWSRPNGLQIERVRTPLGIIGVIYESRPNVTLDAGALCLKSGNASILRGGTDCFHSAQAIHKCMVEGLESAGLPVTSIQLVPTTNRDAVGEMLQGLNGNLDVIVPRGGKNLVERVQSEARVPVFAHLEGLCHIYVDKSADLEMAKSIVVNAKLRRTGICGAMETLLIDSTDKVRLSKPIVEALLSHGCEVRGDDYIQTCHADVKPASESDWSTEYLDSIVSVKLVDGIDSAISHIDEWSSHHTEAIIAEDGDIVKKFFTNLDSAILLHNASTQFADGGEFGMGAEIGIATGKMHARGPVGVDQLTSFKYRVLGTGQVRP